jgi:hypothetical protein
MDAALKTQVLPFLRGRGFKGSLPHLRRPLPGRIDLITFQFDKYGGGFVVEIAQCPPQGVTMHWGEVIPAATVTAHHVNERLRLGSRPPAEDNWFRYDTGSPSVFEDQARQVIALLQTDAENWWKQRAEQRAGV